MSDRVSGSGTGELTNNGVPDDEVAVKPGGSARDADSV
jgi:hypothetical protein